MGALSIGGTDSSTSSWSSVHEPTAQTNSGLSAEHHVAVGSAIMELRRLSGMTWEQLANLFGVSRRTVHFWASGKALNAANEEKLYRVISTIQRIDRGSAQENREILFMIQPDGAVPIDLIRAGRYAEVVDRLSGTQRERRAVTRLSPEARAMRMPMRPAVLANALQDKIHKDSGRTRIARVARVKNKSQGDET